MKKLAFLIIIFSPLVLPAQCWDKVYTNDNYTVGKKSDGSYWVWGRNEGAVYGDGSNTESHVPVQLAVQDIQMLACGIFHMAAIKPDGTLWGWGSNLYGQLAQGDTSDAVLEPVQMGTDSDWVSVFSGWCATFAIKSDGSLWACGFNYQGQLGVGSPNFIIGQLTRVGTDNDWAYVNGGFFNTFAIKSNGTLWGMGSNDYGQIGDGTLTQRNTPVQIGIDSNWTKACSGTSHTVALKNDGTLWSWGAAYAGLGIVGGDLHVPTQVAGIWSDVSTNNFSTLALKPDNTLWGWGYNGSHALGSDLPNQPLPIQLSPDAGWVAISTGGYHSAAIKSDHTLWTCGLNSNGQMGDGTFTGVNTDNEGVFPFQTVSCTALSTVQNPDLHPIEIYPNPVKMMLNIQTDVLITSAKILDLSGRQVFAIHGSSHSLDLQGLRQGVYVLIVNSEKGNRVFKFVKE